MKKNKSDKIFDTVNLLFMIGITFIMIYPLYFTIIASISDPYKVVTGEVTFFPKKITFDAYKNVFSNSRIWIGYKNTIIYTLFGTLLNLFLTIPVSYGLSKKGLPGRRILSWCFLFVMYFNGGMIPTYIVVRNIGLYNKAYTLILLMGINVFNVIVARVFFETSIPDSLYESARIDGASEMKIFASIALPLSKPIIAVMALFYGVYRWNDYMNALIYISSQKLFPLQLVLRGILVQNQQALAAITEIGSVGDGALETAVRRAYMAEAMKYAIIFIASAPLLAVYPFVQKYFVKGVMIGSIKG